VPRQFTRRYELIIQPVDGDTRRITDLRINFEITKSLISYPNLAKIIIYNANIDTRAALQRNGTRILLNAGYEGDTNLLFVGEIRNVYHYKAGPDRISLIYAGDGQRDWDNANINTTFSASITTREVIDTLLATFANLTVGPVEGVPDTASRLRGQTLSGKTSMVLDELARELGFNWSIQDEEVVISPVNSFLAGDESVLITADTGLLNVPVLTEVGVDVRVLLNHRLLPNRAFTIESTTQDSAQGNLFLRTRMRSEASGIYKVQEVKFVGNSRQGDWVANVRGLTPLQTQNQIIA